MNFDQAFERLIGNEGVLSLDPKDSGNWTGRKVGVGTLKGSKYGISAASYPMEDIANLTLERAKAIYLRDFWQSRFPPELAFQFFDAAVNHGTGNAARMLQRAVGVRDDGSIGPLTLRALAAMKPWKAVALFLAERLEFWTNCENWDTQGKGWTRRGAKNIRYLTQDAE